MTDAERSSGQVVVSDSRNTKDKRIRAFAWLFTLNNYTEEDISHITDPILSEKYEYIFQEEKGQVGTKHLQGYIKYKNKVSFSTVKKLLPKAHIETAKNKYAVMNYCRKDNTRNGKIYKNFDPDREISQQYIPFDEQLKMTLEEAKKRVELEELKEKLEILKILRLKRQEYKYIDNADVPIEILSREYERNWY